MINTEHVFSVMCASTSEEGNVFSLVNLISTGGVSKLPAKLPGFCVVTEWFSNIEPGQITEDTEISLGMRCRLKSPDKIVTFFKQEEIKYKTPRYRVVVDMKELPIETLGTHFILIDMRQGKRWKTVAKLPFYVSMRQQPKKEIAS